MWAGYEEALVRYGLDVCAVWSGGGHADMCAVTLVADLTCSTGIATARPQAQLGQSGELPPWLGMSAFHRRHQSALLRNDPAHYGPIFPDIPDDLPYVWPASDRVRRVPV
jgi:hypothetical protein